MTDVDTLNFVTFQVWVLCIAFGAAVSVLLANPLPLIIAPWVGFITGVLVNEILSDGVNEGVRIA